MVALIMLLRPPRERLIIKEFMSLHIIIETIPHNQQRYDTVGDWQFKQVNGETHLHIKISAMNDWHQELPVAVHELIEAYLCKEHGIDEKDVDRWDTYFENANLESINCITEPGEHPQAPYYEEHFIATNIERILVSVLGTKWYDYEKIINSL